ncbi:GIY-YIG nuclease family protein [Psychrosphaera ytuae]|uniref:GIY-YIG nuclease family protein n=1 Tax=Psychrosphaera ytuae TaxID=2820710 RepID=A0A975HHR0_9GAMM|nr:GIY-YIG nuclease family protein [Psychrosphaera ytuae]QTH63357.1 GIY-YIG nuclease family protein [Psychrosphaera ytuae]
MEFNLPKSFLINGTTWCKQVQDLTESEFNNLYTKKTRCYITPNNKNQKKANVYVWGSRTLLGFIDEAEYELYQEYIDQFDSIYCEIEPKTSLTYVVGKAFINVFEYLGTEESQPPLKPTKSPNKTTNKKKPISAPLSPRAKHPITNKSFAPKRNLESFCNKLNGKIGIYCIYGKDFKTYIGQSKNVGKRLKAHIRDLKKGIHHNPAMQTLWLSKQPYSNNLTFELVEETTIDLLDSKELEYIDTFETYKYGFNQTKDGQGDSNKNGYNPERNWLNKFTLTNEKKLTNKTVDIGVIDSDLIDAKSQQEVSSSPEPNINEVNALIAEIQLQNEEELALYRQHELTLLSGESLQTSPSTSTETTETNIVLQRLSKRAKSEVLSQEETKTEIKKSNDLIEPPTKTKSNKINSFTQLSPIRTKSDKAAKKSFNDALNKTELISKSLGFQISKSAFKFGKLKSKSFIEFESAIAKLTERLDRSGSQFKDEDINMYKSKIAELRKLIQ